LIVGDLMEMRKADLVVSGSNTSVLLGNGDGTFYTAPGASLLWGAAAGDFNGGGKTDLIIDGYLYSEWEMALSNSIFTLGLYGTGRSRGINEDGKLDLVVMNYSGVTVALGKGMERSTLHAIHHSVITHSLEWSSLM